VAVRVVATDRPGLLAKISRAFAEADINISQANVKTSGDRALIDLQVEITGIKELTDVLRDIQRIDGVHAADRA
jgi:GTP pyrophosphokinase